MVVCCLLWWETYTHKEGRKELVQNPHSHHVALDSSLRTTTPNNVPKTLRLGPDEAAYLLKKVEAQKFGLDDEENRLMCVGLRGRLRGCVEKTEPLFPAKQEEDDDDAGTD